VNNELPMLNGERKTNWLWVCGRVANVTIAALLALAGLRLYLYGGAGWCPFEGMSNAVTRIIGGGFLGGGILLFPARTAAVGLPLVAGWVLLWMWTPWRSLWGYRLCWQSAIVAGCIALNMALMGLSDRKARSEDGTKLMVFFGSCCLAAGVFMWLRGN